MRASAANSNSVNERPIHACTNHNHCERRQARLYENCHLLWKYYPLHPLYGSCNARGSVRTHKPSYVIYVIYVYIICLFNFGIDILVSHCHIKFYLKKKITIVSGQTQSCHFEIANPQTAEPLPLFNVPFLHSLPLLPVIVNSCCVYYKARRGPWSLRHEPRLLSRSRRPHFPGPPCRSGPSWPLG